MWNARLLLKMSTFCVHALISSSGLLNWKQQWHTTECEYNQNIQFVLPQYLFSLGDGELLFFFSVLGAVTLLIHHHRLHLKVEDLLSAATRRWGHGLSAVRTATMAIVPGSRGKWLGGDRVQIVSRLRVERCSFVCGFMRVSCRGLVGADVIPVENSKLLP